MKTVITKVPQSPPSVSPYSLGVIAGPKLLFVAGQGPWDPQTGKFERGSIREQTRLTLESIRRIIEAAGGRMENAVSVRVFLQPLTTESFAEMNAVYAGYWGPDKPARTTVGAQLLKFDVEIDCVVALE
jgi:2-iminobutanoate/2-iminopropanoate deaminase